MDKGHRYADKELEKIASQITEIFGKADEKVIEIMKRYLKKYEAEIKKREQMVADGEMTEREFEQWFIQTATTGKEWSKVRDEITAEYQKSSKEAMEAAGLGLTAIYLFNRQFASEAIQKQIRSSFKKNIKLSFAKKQIIPNKRPDPTVNQRWHRKKIESVIRQGMKKGYSIDKIARRLHKVTNMDRVAAYRAARTGVTAAENMGRVDAMLKAQEMGIKYDKVWYATLDDRTRTSHRVMHGERVPCDEYFSNGLFEPADPSGEPEEIYNCRCTLLWVPSEQLVFDIEEGPDGMGKLEWSAQKPVSKPYPRWK